MRISAENGDNPALIVENARSVTATFLVLFKRSGGRWQGKEGETEDFSQLPRHMQIIARRAFPGKEFSSYRVESATILSSKRVRATGRGRISLLQ